MKPELPASVQALFADAHAAFDKLVAAAPGHEARQAFKDDFKEKTNALAQQTLAKMGAVPRADFDIQRDMIIALRARVDVLEKALTELQSSTTK